MRQATVEHAAAEGGPGMGYLAESCPTRVDPFGVTELLAGLSKANRG